MKLICVALSSFKYERQPIKTEDGGTIALDWVSYPDAVISADAPLVILHHGMLGDSNSEYLVFLANALARLGFRVVCVVARGLGNLEITSTKTIVWYDTSDFRIAIQTAKAAYPKATNTYAIAFSLGAGMLLRYLSDYANNSELDKAIAVSPPWNIAIETPVFPIWSTLLVFPLKLFILRHYSILAKTHSSMFILKMLTATNLKSWDSIFLDVYGLKTIDEYYKLGSAAFVAKDITIPCLAISARDDPICSVDGAPTLEQLGPSLCLVKTKYGGHLAFPSDTGSITKSWADELIISWLLN